MLVKRSILNRNFYSNNREFTIRSIDKVINDGDVYYITLNILGKYDFSKTRKLKLYRQLDDGGYFEETFEVVSSVINPKPEYVGPSNPGGGIVQPPGDTPSFPSTGNAPSFPSTGNTPSFPITGSTGTTFMMRFVSNVPESSDGNIFDESIDIPNYGETSIDITVVTIKYPNFKKYFLAPSSFVPNKTYCLENGRNFEGSEILFDKVKHICILDRGDINIKYQLYCGETFEDLSDDFCDGYLLYDNRSCYKITNGNGVLLNITSHKLKYDGKEYQTFIPFSINGYDNRNFMFVEHDSDVTFDISKDFIIEDCRFFHYEGGKCKFHKNTVIRPFVETINIGLPLSFDFSSNLYHDQLLEDYVDEIKNSYVTKPLDYEKNMFTAVYYNGEDCFDVNSIRFNIFLRKKHFFEDTMEWKLAKVTRKQIIDEEGNDVEVDVWEEDNNAYWNSYFYDGGIGAPYYTGYTINNGDLLGDLGFDDNDVLNQNKRLGKTFIRLLFFDSKDRNTQTLLYYSTIFINTVDLYAKYINNITLHTFLVKGATQYVENPISNNNLREKTQLSCNFTCFNKNNMSGSSEGYYLYLFPTLVEDGEREIYMRVEFNHAKYGQTVPMICPKDGFPRENYTTTVSKDNKDKIMTDLNALYNDMYIPIKIKYCENKGGYVWYFSDMGKNKNNPVFNLWEPKIR